MMTGWGPRGAMIAYVLLRGDEGTRGWMGASETGDE